MRRSGQGWEVAVQGWTKGAGVDLWAALDIFPDTVVRHVLVTDVSRDGALTGGPFTNRIDFVYFDFWHYDGRTSKHGAFMGGADFVHWHGNYPMVRKTVEIESMAAELRRQHGQAK